MSFKKKILLIEDDLPLIEKIKSHISSLDYELHVENTTETGYNNLLKIAPHVVLVKHLSPIEQQALEFCKKLKEHPRFLDIPVFFLADDVNETSILLGLEIGAEDYLPRSISLHVLFAKIKNILAKQQKEPSSLLSFGDFVLDLQRYTLKKGDVLLDITLSQFEILKHLARHKGQVLTRSQLLDHIQDKETAIIDRNIDVHIASLRKKLGPHFHWIETIRGVGYRFSDSPLKKLQSSLKTTTPNNN